MQNVLLIVWVLGCDTSSAGGPATAGSGSGSVSARCEDIRSRFRATLAKRTDACKTAADCGCYNPVGGPDEGCGGVTDNATIAKLDVLQREFEKVPCAWTHQCGAWACAPRCDAGRCMR